MHSKIKMICEIGIIGIVSIGIYLISGRSICLFRNLFGIPCPTCGMTRAYLHLLQGDISGAFKYHPLFWAVPIILLRRRWIFYGMALLFIAVWGVRMYLYFPKVEPLIFNDEALYILVIKKLGMI